MDSGAIIGVIGLVITVIGGFASIWKLLTDKITAVHDRVNLLQDRVAKIEGNEKVLENDLEHLKGDLAQLMARLEKKLDKLELSLEAHMKEEPEQLRALLRQELRGGR